MPNIWNLGNTTLRNPNRIAEGLRIFADEFQGQFHGAEQEAAFFRRLLDEGVVYSEGSQREWFGRKWRSAFVKIGFATNYRYYVNGEPYSPLDLARNYPDLGLQGVEVELTPVGNQLISSSTTGEINDVFLRQLIRHEIPNPIEHEYPDGMMKPFILLLQVLKMLEENGTPGITKTETGMYLQPFQNHNLELVIDIFQRIIRYREARSQYHGIVPKKNFDIQQLEMTRHQFNTPAISTLMDYADTTFRYSQMSGLVTRRGGSLIIRPEKSDLVSAILQNEPQFLVPSNPEGYLTEYYRGSELPTDNISFALEEIHRLSNQIRSFNSIPSSQLNQNDIGSVQDVNRIRYVLIEQLKRLREEQFAITQGENDSISEILEYLIELNTPRRDSTLEIIEPPSFLEWAVWRSFLAIDHIRTPIHETRGFPLDEDLMPCNPAPGGRPDMFFEFDDFILVVEVTLTRNTRQVTAEGEPVPRHVAEIMTGREKAVYCLFIAPVIDTNTAETFRLGVWYRDETALTVDIVPITLMQFINLIRILHTHRYTPIQLKNWLVSCLSHRAAEAPEWKRLIENTTNAWIEQITSE